MAETVDYDDSDDDFVPGITSDKVEDNQENSLERQMTLLSEKLDQKELALETEKKRVEDLNTNVQTEQKLRKDAEEQLAVASQSLQEAGDLYQERAGETEALKRTLTLTTQPDEDWDAKVTVLEEEKKASEAQLEKKEAELAEANGKIESNKEEFEQFKSTMNEKLQDQLKIQIEEKEKFDQEMQTYKDQLQTKTTELAASESKNETLSGQVEAAQKELQNLNVAHEAKVQSVTETLQNELESANRTHETKLQAATESAGTVHEANMQSVKDEYEAKLQSLQNELESLSRTHETKLQSVTETLQNELESGNRTHETKLQAVTEEYESFKLSCEAERKEAAEEKHAEIKKATEAVREEKEALTAKLEEIASIQEKEVKEARETVEKAQQAERTATSQMKEAQKEIETLKHEAQARTEGATIQTSQIAELEKEVQKHKTVAQSERNKAGGFAGQVDNLKKDIKALQLTKGEKVKEVKKISDEKKELKTQLRKYRNECGSLTKQLEQAKNNPSGEMKEKSRAEIAGVVKKWKDKLEKEKKSSQTKIRKIKEMAASSSGDEGHDQMFYFVLVAFIISLLANIVQASRS